MSEEFTKEDEEVLDLLTKWLHISVERIGPVKTRWALEVVLKIDLTKMPLQGTLE